MSLIILYITSNSNEKIKTFIKDYNIAKIYNNIKCVNVETFNKIII